MQFKIGDKVKFKVGKGFGDGIDNVTKHDTGVIVSIDTSGDELPLLVACTTDKGKTINYYMGAKREVVLVERIESVQQSDDDTPCDDLHKEHHLDHLIDCLKDEVRLHKLLSTNPLSVVTVPIELEMLEIMIANLESHARLTY